MPPTHPTRRAALFSIADSRGNNPHGTSETADAEGRRRNAGRYETVGDIDRALDRRARPPRQVAPQLGAEPPQAVPQPEPGNILGALLLVAVGAAIAYVATRPSSSEEESEDEPREKPRENPPVAALSPPPPVVVVQPPVVPTPVVTVTNPTPVVTVVSKPRRRRRAAPPPSPPTVV